MSTKIQAPSEQNHVKTKEFGFYLAAIFFYTMMTGIVGSYRQAYLVNVLALTENQVSFYNGFLSIAGFVMSFVYAIIIDNRKITKREYEKVIEKLVNTDFSEIYCQDLSSSTSEMIPDFNLSGI